LVWNIVADIHRTKMIVLLSFYWF